MAAASWGDDEDDALQGLRQATQLIYLRGLRKYMDFSTGVVGGPMRRVCYQGLSEVCEVIPAARSTSKGERLTKSGVRAAIRELIRAGLIVSKTKPGSVYLVFFLPLAVTDKSARNMSVTTATRNSGTKNDSAKSNQGNELHDDSDTVGDTPHSAMSDTHPSSDKDNKKKEEVIHKVDCISREFKPNADTRSLCENIECPAISDLHVERFIMHYWLSEVVYTPDQWQGAFYKWMLKAKADADADSRNRKKEDWERVPADSNKLEAWAVEHGYPKPSRTIKNHEYRKLLLECVEKRCNGKDRGGK